MPFFKSGDLPSIRADKTSLFSVGFPVRGGSKSVVLECRWGRNEDYALACVARSLLAAADQKQAARDDVAKHIIVGWRNVPKEDGTGDEPYSFAGGAEIVAHMENQDRTDLINAFWLHVSNAALHGAPRLVDAGDLGNG